MKIGEMKMIPKEQIKDFKILIGKFHEEVKSNSVTDLIIWLDCYLEKFNYEMKQMKKPRRR